MRGEGDIFRKLVLAADGEDACLVRHGAVAIGGQELEHVRIIVAVGDAGLQFSRRMVDANGVVIRRVVRGRAAAELVLAGDAQGGIPHVPASAFDHDLRLCAVGQDRAREPRVGDEAFGGVRPEVRHLARLDAQIAVVAVGVEVAQGDVARLIF